MAKLLDLLLLYVPLDTKRRTIRRAVESGETGVGIGDDGRQLDPAPAAPTPRGEVGSKVSFERMATAVLLTLVRTQPARVREWHAGLSRARALSVLSFMARELSPVIVKGELARCRAAMSSGLMEGQDGSEVEMRASAKARIITARYTKDECELEVR